MIRLIEPAKINRKSLVRPLAASPVNTLHCSALCVAFTRVSPVFVA